MKIILLTLVTILTIGSCTTKQQKPESLSEETNNIHNVDSIRNSAENNFLELSIPSSIPPDLENWLPSRHALPSGFIPGVSLKKIQEDFEKEPLYDSSFNFNEFFSFNELKYYPIGKITTGNGGIMLFFFIEGDGEILAAASYKPFNGNFGSFIPVAGLKGSQAGSEKTLILTSEVKKEQEVLLIEKTLEISNNVSGTTETKQEALIVNISNGILQKEENLEKATKKELLRYLSSFPEQEDSLTVTQQAT